MKKLSGLLSVVLAFAITLSGCGVQNTNRSLADIPQYSGSAYVEINNNIPDFDKSDLKARSFEQYSSLDDLGRCGTAYACIGKDLMPTGKRGEISQVKPSGWHSVKYDIVEGKSLYNRCHLIGYQLTGENANERNLITGTRYMNTTGMLPFENMVADYIKETDDHVLYRVTPVFEGNNLVANGVQMEAQSVEDDGEGICFNVFVYNVQPGVTIDYATGESKLSQEKSPTPEPQKEEPANTASGDTQQYILNTGTRKFHKPSCGSGKKMKEENREEYIGSAEALIEQGYSPCKACNP